MNKGLARFVILAVKAGAANPVDTGRMAGAGLGHLQPRSAKKQSKKHVKRAVAECI